MSEWHYNRNGQNLGPVSAAELKRLAATGDLAPKDLVWKDGMANWAPAERIKGLFAVGARPATAPVIDEATDEETSGDVQVAEIAAPVATPAAAIAYYTSNDGVPTRATTTLAGYSPSTGDRGVWPLNDQQIEQLKETEKWRKKIRSAAGLYKLFFALTLIGAVVVVLVGLLATGNRGPGAVVMAVVGAFMAGFATLYYFCWRATTKCHRWAPLTMFILIMLSIAVNVISTALAAAGPNGGAAILGGVIGLILPTIFAIISWNAFASIPKFLTQPLWAQEVLVSVNM